MSKVHKCGLGCEISGCTELAKKPCQNTGHTSDCKGKYITCAPRTKNKPMVDPNTKIAFRSLADILREADNHYTENPTHGMGCACLDYLVAEIRRNLIAVDHGSTAAQQRNYKTGFDWFSTAASMIMRNSNHKYDGPSEKSWNELDIQVVSGVDMDPRT